MCQHQIIYDSHDVKLAAIFIQALILENVSKTYILNKQLEHNISNEDDKHWLYEMFVAYYCDGCSMAPLTQYKIKEIKQELTREKDYFSSKSDERLYIDMRRSKCYTDNLEKLTCGDGGVNLSIKFKAAATKKNEVKSNYLFTI